MTREGRGRCQNPHISELLSAHADGALDPRAAMKVEEHVAGCGSCAFELGALRSLLGDLRGLSAGPARSDESWSDLSRSVKVAWQRSRDEAEAARAGSVRRLLWRLVAGTGTALALGTAALLIVPRLVGSPGRQAIEGSLGAARPEQRVSPSAPRPLPDSQARRIEAAGRLGDDLDDLDPDDLLDGLDDHQLEQVGKALTPGA